MSTDPAESQTIRGVPAEGGQRNAAASGMDWALIGRQLIGILQLELRHNLFSRRSFALYFLAFAPVALLMIWTISPMTRNLSGPAQAITQVFLPVFCGLGGELFPVGYLRVVIFLGALITFMSLYRSEILERSLHYYYLTPVRRWVLVVGKYCSALISACAVFSVATVALFILTCLPWGLGATTRYLFDGPGLSNLTAYVGIAILACIGYGAVFLLVGLSVKNAIIPAFFIWGWEALNFILPTTLKKISVIYYLRTLYPIPLSEGLGPIEVIAEPTSPWISIPGLLIFTALLLAVAGWRARHMEINYGGE